MNQAVKDIAATIDDWGFNPDNGFEVFVIVQRGLDIGFFEYHNAQSNLDEDGIPHFRGCVSLTQDIPCSEPAVVPSTTAGLRTLMFDDARLRTLADRDQQEVREVAWSYETPCIFNINDHEAEINLIMNHMLIKRPRG